MDALSDVLRVAQLTGGVFLHAEFFAPWCIKARLSPEHCAPVLGPASHLIIYHYVVEGDLRIRVDGEQGEGVALGPGDVALLPRNDLHLMGSDLSLPPVAGGDVIQPPKDGGLFSIDHGGGGGRTQMICGFLGCAGAERNPVIRPCRLCSSSTSGTTGRLNGSLDTPIWVGGGRLRPPGSATMLAKLSELLFLEAVRRYAETLPDGQTGWLAGLREPHVGRALALLHREVARRWTVEDLGSEVSLRVRPGRPIHSSHRHAADALPRELAHTGRDKSSGTAARPRGGRESRLRLRGGLLRAFKKASVRRPPRGDVRTASPERGGPGRAALVQVRHMARNLLVDKFMSFSFVSTTQPLGLRPTPGVL